MRALALVLGLCACNRVFGVEFDGERDAAPIVDTLPPGDWVAIETATQMSCGLRADRSLWCWGTDSLGSLGIEGLTEALVPTRVGTATWSSISLRDRHVCGIQDTDASLWCWGNNASAQLGFAQDSLSHAPTRLGSARWSRVSVGRDHTCGIQEDNTLWCWGYGLLGQLGDGNFTNVQPAPVTIAGGGTWTRVSAGADHTCAVQTDGSLWCWGNNIWGQIGQPLVFGGRGEPGRVGMDAWTDVTAGFLSTCGILADGRLRCWGNNEKGQLGLGTTTYQVRPRPVGNDANGWTALHLGENHACGVREGELWCWGDNEHGAVARSEAGAIVSTPLRVEQGPGRWKTASTGARHTCAISDDANLWCAGSDASGQQGLGTGGVRRTPRLVAGDVRATEIAVGKSTACLVDLDGRMHCWGSDAHGSLGAESPLASNRPIPVYATGTWNGLSGGFEDFFCALRDNKRSCWGFGGNGQHGLGNYNPLDVPVEDPTYSWTQIATGQEHVCALQVGTQNLYCWGANFWGQLGSGTTQFTNDEGTSPVGGAQARYKAIVTGVLHTCAIDLADALRCWGLDSSGQLGDGTPTNVAEPTPKVVSTGPISKVALGGAHSCSLSGTQLACWGWHGYGQLGFGPGQEYAAAPMPVAGTWADLALGTDHTCAIDSAGALYCWGRNDRGQVGDGTLEHRAAPVLIDTGPWLAVRARIANTCGIKSDNTVWCWGESEDGQIGDGAAWSRELRWVPPP